ncbi:MAG TPA: hypothetical protein VLF60_04510 [Candidatus Saccharimonadales bacterium]|nr:hypothetical protein [Candidatus Saccharimonadales bacterium]
MLIKSFLLVTGFAVSTLAAALTGSAQAQSATAISQGFETNDPGVTVGALVVLEPGKQGIVHLATPDQVSGLAGVVANKPLVELSSSGKSVQVVTSGVTKVLVSDINGAVKTGDKITASPISGVGMKANSSTQIVGIAQADLQSGDVTERTITDKQGKQQQVHIGVISVQINISYYMSTNDKRSLVPAFLQGFANSIAGKDVSIARVLASSLVLLLGFMSIAVLLYASIHSSIISIGRNPLSENAVRKSLFEVGAIAIGILLVMLIAIYLILTT